MSLGLVDLAQKLEFDIRRRGLSPGARYLTAEESAHLLGTSVATANRALRILAGQELVVRRRNSGTFVGPAVVRANTTEIRTVNILTPATVRYGAAVRFDLLIEGILSNMEDVADVRVSYVPGEDGIDFVRNLVEPVRQSGKLAGVIAISCSREVYRYLGENELPFVVMGSLYPDQPYPSIDTDEHCAGELLTKYLVGRGHRKLALFSDSESCPGDNYFHDGVSAALTAAGLAPNAMVLRVPGPDPAVLREQVTEVISMSDRPTGFLVKLPRWADEIASVVREHRLKVPRDAEIVFKGYAVGEQGKSCFPHVRPNIAYRSIAELAGQMLAQVRWRQPLPHKKVIIPYEMCNEPEIGVVD